jgi:nicotinate-nucleotide adenylyltransferase
MRVALFGGSFNPPHLAHQMAVLYVLETAPIDEVWIIPAFRHAYGKVLAPFEDRLAMCELAARAFGPRARVSDVERELGDESRTLRTVRLLRDQFPGHAFSLVIGADLVPEVSSWYGGAELQRTVPFIVVGRAGVADAEVADAEVEGAGRGHQLALPEISSTQVRAALGAAKPVEGLVPRLVLDYIYAHGLYGACEELV